jgi:hypothetical protein
MNPIQHSRLNHANEAAHASDSMTTVVLAPLTR